MWFSKKICAAILGARSRDDSVAFIADRYFLFEEVKIPRKSLNRGEVGDMARLAIEEMLPPGTQLDDSYGTGFFEGKRGDSVTAFVSSRDRLLSEMPELRTCPYWLPEKFFYENICKLAFMPVNGKCVIADLTQSGKFSMQGRTFGLFSKEFWTAELHGEEYKIVQKVVWLTNRFHARVIPALLASSSFLLLIFMASLLFGGVNVLAERKLKLKVPRINRIIERSKLRDEILLFQNGKSLCFQSLDEVNDLRPSTLLFDEFYMEGAKVARFIGVSDSPTTLNAFVDRLRKLPEVKEARVVDVVSTQKEATFNLKVEFLRP
jgi:hypothetical protein